MYAQQPLLGQHTGRRTITILILIVIVIVVIVMDIGVTI